MKKWMKWALGILAVLIIGAAIFLKMNWATINILKGTQGISEGQEPIPAAASAGDFLPVEKGDADYVSWLNAGGSSRSKVTGIKKDWSQGFPKVWEVNYLCQGEESATWSAPVVQGRHLVVAGRDDANDLLFCLNAADGTLLWKTAQKADAKNNHGTGPRATPAIDDDRVYTFGRTGLLTCWNLFDGKEVWQQNISKLGGQEPTWGHASSPLIWNDLVIVQGGGEIRTIAFDKMSGEIAWKTGNGIAGYAAPMMMDFNGSPILLVFHAKGLSAINPATGANFWDTEWITSYDVNATTPVAFENQVFITSGYKVGCELLKVDTTKVDVIWTNKVIAAHHSDPYIIDGYIYGYSGDSFQNRGKFKCVELADGAEKWTTNDMGWGTCMFVDNHLLCCDIKGNIFLMKPNPNEFVKVTQMEKALGEIDGPVWTMPVVANGKLYLRFKQRLVCYDILD